jgi:hypothetical protein
MSRIFLLLLLTTGLHSAYGSVADSAKWPFPDTLTLNFSVYGLVHSYHVQYDPRTNQKGPNNYDYFSLDWTRYPALHLDRSDSLWHFVDSTQTWVREYNNDYQYMISHGSIAITIDTLTHVIKSLSFEKHYGVTPEDLNDYKFSFNGLKYQDHTLSILDSNIESSFVRAEYTHNVGMHSYDYGSTTQINVYRIAISGGLTYSIHDLLPPPQPERPTQIQFDTVLVNSHKSITFKVTDTSSRRLALIGVAIVNANAEVFSWGQNGTPSLLDSGQSQDFTMVFSPKSAGSVSAQLQFALMNPDGSLHMDTIPIMGIGNDAVSAVPTEQCSTFTIFPNPANRYIAIDADEISNLRLHSVSGETIFEILVYPNQKVELPTLATGLYLAEIQSGDTIIKRKLVIR